MKLILSLLLIFSIGWAGEKTFRLPSTARTDKEYRLFCELNARGNEYLFDQCILRQKDVLQRTWTVYTNDEANELQGFFSFCIGTNRKRIVQGIDKYGRYYERWAWSPEATFDCITKREEIKKQKEGQSQDRDKSDLKGERSYRPGYGNANPTPQI